MMGTKRIKTDSTTSNQVLPQNQGVFKNYAYWLGDPDVGYGDDWNEPMSVGQMESAKQILTIPTYPDYYAEGDYLVDQFGNIEIVRTKPHCS